MSTVDTAAIRTEWLKECGVHDFGIAYTCTCPDGDPRPVIAKLADEVDRLRQMHTAAVAAYRELDFVILRDALGLPATGQDGADV